MAAKKPVTQAEVAAGIAALLKFTDHVSTKRDIEGAVRCVLEAAQAARTTRAKAK